jgi:hypothetical protein
LSLGRDDRAGPHALHKFSRRACYIRDSPVARARLDTGGGWRRTCAGRERRWPSFIIWRWAGRALDGWIRYRWIIPLLQVPVPVPRLQPRSMTATSRHPVPGQLARGRRLRAREGRGSLRAGNQPAGNPPAGSPPGKPARSPARNQRNDQRRRGPRSRLAARPPGSPLASPAGSRPRGAVGAARSAAGASQRRGVDAGARTISSSTRVPPWRRRS